VKHKHRSLRRRLQNWLPSPESLHGHPWLGRWLRPLVNPRLWALRRRTVALGAAIGATFCVIPLPVQIPLAVLGAILSRANLPAAVAATLISNPITMVAILTAAWEVGSFALDDGTGGLSFDPEWFAPSHLLTPQAWLDALGAIAGPLVLGLPVIGVALGTVT